MADVTSGERGIEAADLRVEPQPQFIVGSLRYFDAAGPLSAELARIVGGPLPGPLRAARYPADGSSDELILAWRGPTETVLMSTSRVMFGRIASCAAEHPAAGCLVEQTGGLRTWRVSGARTRGLLLRVGSNATVPELGEARTSRVAELPVTALCVRPGEVLLLCERVYGPHLLGWISASAADF